MAMVVKIFQSEPKLWTDIPSLQPYWLLVDILFPTLPSLAWLRTLDRSSMRANRSPTANPSPRRTKRPRRSLGCRASEVWALSAPIQLLAHHLSRRYVSSPDSLSWRMAMVRFLTSGEPGEARRGSVIEERGCWKSHSNLWSLSCC